MNMEARAAPALQTSTAGKVYTESFQAIFNATPECVKVIGPDGTVLQMNAAGLAMLGADTEAEIVGKSALDLVAPEHRDAFRRFNDAVCAGNGGSLQYEVIAPDGTRRQVETRAVPLQLAIGIVDLAITRDVTERKLAERAAHLLSAIVESSDDAIISKDLNGVITSWNRSAERLFGFTAQDAIGKTVAELLIPSDRSDEEPKILARLRRGERVEHFDTVRKRKDGSLVEISLTISPVRDGEGLVVGASKIARNISQRKRSERDTSLLSSIVQSSDDAIISKDLDGVITSWNKSAERLFGYSADEAIGRTVTDLVVPPDRHEEESNILARLRRGERIEHFETMRIRKDGTLVDIELTSSPLLNADGEIIGASKIVRDITDRRRSERAIAELNEHLKQDLAAMTRMQQLSTRMVGAESLAELLDEVVVAGMDMAGAEMGVIQVVEDGGWNAVAYRGFDGETWTGDIRSAVSSESKNDVRVVVEHVADSARYSAEQQEWCRTRGVLAFQSTPLKSRSGEVLGVFSTYYRKPHRASERELHLLDILARQAADLIERNRAIAALTESESRFRQLANSMPQIVWTAEPDGRVDYFNDRWFAFSGASRDGKGNKSWESGTHPDDVEQAKALWHHSLQTGEPFGMELRLWDRADKQWRWFIARAVAVKSASGAVMKWFGSSTDIHEQKEVEAELRRANQDLEQFAFSASHDLQEPLRAVKIYSELLAKRYEHKLDGQALSFLKHVRSGATRMELLVKDLLEYTRVTTQEDPAELVDANEVLNESIANLESAIRESGASVTFDSLPKVYVHASHLQQLFQNLIGNAIKYASPHRLPRVHVAAQSKNETWIFAVSDNGIGIDSEYKEKIFGLFKRLHTGESYSGTGIGLAICQRIIDRCHGRIWVESAPEQGSTFYFTLPK